MHVPLHGDFFPQCSCGRLCTHTDMWCMIWLNGSMTALWRATWEQGVHLSIWYSQTQMLCLTPRWCPINGCWKKKWLQFGEGRINLDMVVVQSLSRVQLLVTPWTTAHQASLTFTTSRSLFRFMSIESVMLSNHLFFCYPFSFCLQSFPASASFLMNQLFASGGQSIAASATVLPMNIQGFLHYIEFIYVSIFFSPLYLKSLEKRC